MPRTARGRADSPRIDGRGPWILALAFVGVGAVVGSLATAMTDAGAYGGWRHGHGMFGHRPDSAAEAIERVQYVSAWVLGSVDATDEQRERVDAILADAVADIFPLHAEHHDHESDWIAELTRPSIDPAGLERVRAAELALAERATTRALEATIAIAEVLDPDQRHQIVSRFVDRWH